MHQVFQQYSPNESPPSYYDIEETSNICLKKTDGKLESFI